MLFPLLPAYIMLFPLLPVNSESISEYDKNDPINFNFLALNIIWIPPPNHSPFLLCVRVELGNT